MSKEQKEQLPCLRAQGIFWYNSDSNSELVSGLETAKFTFRSTVQLCAAIKHRGALLVMLLNRLLAVPQSGQDIRSAPLFFSAQGGATK